MSKLSIDQQKKLAEWKREQARSFLRDAPARLVKDDLDRRLKTWGIVFTILGLLMCLIGGCLLVFNDTGSRPASAIPLVLLGLATTVVGILDLNRKTPTMLFVTGCLGLVNGLLLFALASWFVGLIMVLTAILALRDVADARKYLRKSDEQGAAPLPHDPQTGHSEGAH